MVIGSGAVIRRPIKEEIYDVLHAGILAGQYRAGAWLRQDDIAGRLGVSMTPVREALDLLVSSGLAERVPYKGVRLIEPSPADIIQSYTVRLLLEGFAALEAAPRISADDHAALCKILETAKPLVHLGDLPKERMLSRELHSRIVASTGNRLLHRMYLTALNSFPDWMLYEHLYRQPDLLTESMEREFAEHRGIVEALVIHDTGLAVRRSLDHVKKRGQEISEYLGVSAKDLMASEACVLPLFEAGIPSAS
jgi:DNA-binding GntR family transcriptional regulator